MKTCILSLQTSMDSHGVSLANRGALAYTAAARAIAYHLPLPTSPVNNPYAYFLEKYRAEVEAELDEINENFVIRTAEAFELTRQLWVFRYQLVYDVENPSVVNILDVIATTGDRNLAPTYGKLVAEYESALRHATAIICDALCQKA